MLEIGWELTDVAHVLVASQTIVPGSGNDYALLLANLNANSEIDTIEYSRSIVNDFYTKYSTLRVSTSYSAINLAKIGSDFKDNTSYLFEYLSMLSDEQLLEIKKYRLEKIGNLDSDYIEYVDFIQLLEAVKEIATKYYNQNIVEVITKIFFNLNNMIIHHCELGVYNAMVSLNGVSINFPYSWELFEKYSSERGYQILLINQETKWYEVLMRISKL